MAVPDVNRRDVAEDDVGRVVVVVPSVSAAAVAVVVARVAVAVVVARVAEVRVSTVSGVQRA